MSLELTPRLVLAMTLLPHASYVEAFAQLVGVLPRLPWARVWRVLDRGHRMAPPAGRGADARDL